jgi:uncharacterized protein (DUF1684 family)
VLTLLDWTRTIFGLYAQIRNTSDPRAGWDSWRETRDRLFATHEQSPLSAERRKEFRGCRYFDYDPDARVAADVVPLESEQRKIVTSTGVFGAVSFSRSATERAVRPLIPRGVT